MNLHPRRPFFLAALALLVSTAALAQGQGHKHGAHQHGVAKLAVAVDGKLLEIALESPLDNLLGFERAPRTDAEREAVRKMAQRFHAAAGLYTPTPAANCRRSRMSCSRFCAVTTMTLSSAADAPSPPSCAKAGVENASTEIPESKTP